MHVYIVDLYPYFAKLLLGSCSSLIYVTLRTSIIRNVIALERILHLRAHNSHGRLRAIALLVLLVSPQRELVPPHAKTTTRKGAAFVRFSLA